MRTNRLLLYTASFVEFKAYQRKLQSILSQYKVPFHRFPLQGDRKKRVVYEDSASRGITVWTIGTESIADNNLAFDLCTGRDLRH